MRFIGLTTFGLFLAGTFANGQQPGTNAPAKQTPSTISNGTANPQGAKAAPAPAVQAAPQTPNPKLDALLANWERTMSSVTTVAAKVTRTSVNKTFQVAEVYEGTAKYMKPNLAVLRMEKKGKPQIYEKYVCTGTYLYEYVPADKIIRVHEVQQPKPGQVADDNVLSFLFGMRADEAKRRYDMRLVKGPPEDQWYYYLELLPRYPADKADFAKARLVLVAQTFMPRELWFEQPNGDEVKWDIPAIETGSGVKREDFGPPSEPGWKIEQVQRAKPQPRVARPNQP